MTRLRFLILFALLAACGGSAPDVVYVDVRTPEEYALRHVRGALNIPQEQIAQRLSELERYREQRIVVYCRSGRRSALALGVLKANGFNHAEDGGAMDNLTAAGVPLE